MTRGPRRLEVGGETIREGHATLAFVLWQADRLDEAEDEACRAVELAPDDACYHATLALLLWQADRVEEAETEARRATELHPATPTTVPP